MENQIDISKLLELRKLTSAIGNFMQTRLLDYFSTLKPLFAPHTIFGNHTRSGGAEGTVKGEDKAFAELKSAYIEIAGSKLFNQPRELVSPISIKTSRPEVSQMEYPHETTVDGVTKTVTMISPLRWVLTYAGFNPAHLRSLIAQGDNVNDRQMQETLQHIMVMNSIMARNSGLTKLLSHLGFTTSTEHLSDCGNLPFTIINTPISTQRPSDQIILQFTQVSGSPVFEEVVNVQDIINMRTLLKDSLLDEVRKHAEHLLTEEG